MAEDLENIIKGMFFLATGHDYEHILRKLRIEENMKSIIFMSTVIMSLGLALVNPKVTLAADAVARPACTECHEPPPAKTYTHDPYESGECEMCHTVKSTHFTTQEPGSVTIPKTSEACYQCHEPMDSKPVKHEALATGKQCINCHSVHGSNIRGLLKKAAPELCLKCHDVIKHTSPQPTGTIHAVTVELKSCINCHNPHSTKAEHLLKSDPKALCLSCHNKEIPTTWDKEARTIPSIKGILETKKHLHPPFAKGKNCTSACHSPHEADEERLLKLPYPVVPHKNYVEQPNTYGLCFQCHESTMLNKSITGAETNFRKDVKDNKGRITRTNLHWLHVVNTANNTYNQMGRSCAICHDPHGTDQPFMIRTSVSIGKIFDNETEKNFQMPIEYRQLPLDLPAGKDHTGGQCTKSCHFGSNPHIYERLD